MFRAPERRLDSRDVEQVFKQLEAALPAPIGACWRLVESAGEHGRTRYTLSEYGLNGRPYRSAQGIGLDISWDGARAAVEGLLTVIQTATYLRCRATQEARNGLLRSAGAHRNV